MKKLVSIILAAAMILSLGSVAMAYETEQTATVTLTADLGDADCEWSIPATFALTIDNSYSADDNVTITEWKCELGKEWKITADDISVTLSNTQGFSTEASVSFTDLTAGVNTPDSPSAPVSVYASIESNPDFAHLAGTVELTGSLGFTLSYEDATPAA